MRSTRRMLFKGALGTLVAAALGFGATQALASPAAPAAVAGCLKDEAAACVWGCKEQFGSNYVGRCSKNSWGYVTCECYPLVAPAGR